MRPGLRIYEDDLPAVPADQRSIPPRDDAEILKADAVQVGELMAGPGVQIHSAELDLAPDLDGCQQPTFRVKARRGEIGMRPILAGRNNTPDAAVGPRIRDGLG